MNELTIKSSRSAGKLKLSKAKPPGSGHRVEYFRVSLEDREIAASSSRVYIYEPRDLAAYFAELASHWKGWSGAKNGVQWKAISRSSARRIAWGMLLYT